jgi:hypothetical protein
MQKLFERQYQHTYKLLLACISVASYLNSSVADGTVMWNKKTSYNNPEEALTLFWSDREDRTTMDNRVSITKERSFLLVLRNDIKNVWP